MDYRWEDDGNYHNLYYIPFVSEEALGTLELIQDDDVYKFTCDESDCMNVKRETTLFADTIESAKEKVIEIVKTGLKASEFRIQCKLKALDI